MRTSLRPHRAMVATFAASFVFVGFVPKGVAQQSGAKSGKSVYVAIENVPAKAQAKQNPLQNDANAAAAGRKLFEEHCAQCHGMAVAGTRRGPSLLTPRVNQATPAALFWILSNGVIRHGMPDWSKLPEPERWQIVTFLKSMNPVNRRAAGPDLMPSQRAKIL